MLSHRDFGFGLLINFLASVIMVTGLNKYAEARNIINKLSEKEASKWFYSSFLHAVKILNRTLYKAQQKLSDGLRYTMLNSFINLIFFSL